MYRSPNVMLSAFHFSHWQEVSIITDFNKIIFGSAMAGTENSENETAVPQRAVLVSVLTDSEIESEYESSLDELERLLETAGGESFARLTQIRPSPDPRTCIGSGKVEELRELCERNDMQLVVFDCELTPSQIRSLEDDLNGDDKTGGICVIDRTMLILDIFALHAVTSEGKLQVELAQLKYTSPRLTGRGITMSRQQGGNIAMRGPGETKLETDRRHLKRRIDALTDALATMEKNRATQRAQRERSPILKCAIAGYTNAGKSTLLNRLTDAGALTEDKLFATLDPTTRRYTLPDGGEILLTDTVGFIRRLPHQLVNAFRSTLDEVSYADAVLVIIDASDPEHLEQLEVTRSLLAELGAADKPVLYIYNKCDISYPDINPLPEGVKCSEVVRISALTGEGIDELTEKLMKLNANGRSEVVMRIPNTDGGVLNRLYTQAVVRDVEYGSEYMTVRASVDRAVKGQLAQYII